MLVGMIDGRGARWVWEGKGAKIVWAWDSLIGGFYIVGFLMAFICVLSAGVEVMGVVQSAHR